jgi:5-methylcytosine-specific restriction endonuclease McrA
MIRTKQPSDKWYGRAHWTNLRKLVLHRDPICCICRRAASTEVDHIRAHRGDWTLFSDLKNLAGLCHECHSKKTARENMGFGHAPKAPAPILFPTGSNKGPEFSASTIKSDVLDKALELPPGFLDGV